MKLTDMAIESPEGFTSNTVFSNNFPCPSFIHRINLSTSNSVWLPLSSRKLEALNYFLMLHAKHHHKVALGSFIQDKITRLGIINNQFVYNKKYNRIHTKNWRLNFYKNDIPSIIMLITQH